MRGSEFLDKLQLLEPDLIQSAAEEPEKPVSLWKRLSPLPVKEQREPLLIEDHTPPRKRRPFLLVTVGALCLCLLLAPMVLTQNGSPMGYSAPSAIAKGGAEAGEKAADFYDETEAGAWEGGDIENLFQENTITGTGTLRDPKGVDSYRDSLTQLFSVVGLEERSGSLLDWDDCYFLTENWEAGQMASLFSNAKFSAMVLTEEDQNKDSRETAALEAEEFYAAWRFCSPDDQEAREEIVMMVSRKEEWPEFQAFVQAGNSQSQVDSHGLQLYTVGTEESERGIWFEKDSFWFRIYASPGIHLQQIWDVLGCILSGPKGEGLPSLNFWESGFRQYRSGQDLGLLASLFPPAGFAPEPAYTRVVESLYTGPTPCSAEMAFQEEDGALLTRWTVFAENDFDYATPYDLANSLGELEGITRKSLEESYRKSESAGIYQLFFQYNGFQVRGEYQDLGKKDTVDRLWALISRFQKEISRYSVTGLWTEDFSPESYFQHSGLPGEKESLEGVFGPAYGSVLGERSFSRYRQELEDESQRIMPWSDPNQEFEAWASYDDKGQVDLLTVTWTYLDEENYPVSYLKMECSPKTQEGYSDRIWDGGMHYSKTIINREGVDITAIGFPDTSQCLCYETENGWYQFSCDANTNVYELVPLMDFFWLYPIDFDRFRQDKGDRYEIAELNDYPDAFAGYYPTDQRFCSQSRYGELQLLNGVPVYLLISYEETERPITNWTICAEGTAMLPNRMITDAQNTGLSIGELRSLTLNDVAAYMETNTMKHNHRFIFSWDGYLIAAALRPETTQEELWELVQHLQSL